MISRRQYSGTADFYHSKSNLNSFLNRYLTFSMLESYMSTQGRNKVTGGKGYGILSDNRGSVQTVEAHESIRQSVHACAQRINLRIRGQKRCGKDDVDPDDLRIAEGVFG